MSEYLYDVALSFAGEDRPFVGQVADILRKNGVKVFYDEYQRSSLWGKELIQYLEDVYKNKTRYVIVFVSQSYLLKDWTNHELRSALNRAFQSRDEYILPVKLDDTLLPGLHGSIGYLHAQTMSTTDICHLFLEKIGKRSDVYYESSILLYSITLKKYASDILKHRGAGAGLYGGRWNSPGINVIYLSSEKSLAILELAAHTSGIGNNNFALIQFIIPSSVPIKTIYESDLPIGWDEYPCKSDTQIIGDKWVKSQESCLLSVPSVIVQTERNFIVNPEHEFFKLLQMNKIEDFKFSDLLWSNK